MPPYGWSHTGPRRVERDGDRQDSQLDAQDLCGGLHANHLPDSQETLQETFQDPCGGLQRVSCVITRAVWWCDDYTVVLYPKTNHEKGCLSRKDRKHTLGPLGYAFSLPSYSYILIQTIIYKYIHTTETCISCMHQRCLHTYLYMYDTSHTSGHTLGPLGYAFSLNPP